MQAHTNRNNNNNNNNLRVFGKVLYLERRWWHWYDYILKVKKYLLDNNYYEGCSRPWPIDWDRVFFVSERIFRDVLGLWLYTTGPTYVYIVLEPTRWPFGWLPKEKRARFVYSKMSMVSLPYGIVNILSKKQWEGCAAWVFSENASRTLVMLLLRHVTFLSFVETDFYYFVEKLTQTVSAARI